MDEDSPFFKIDKEIEISTIKELFDLTKKKTYGTAAPDLSGLKAMMVFPQTYDSFTTSGIFRGQRKDWPLIPAAYRIIKRMEFNKEIKEADIRYKQNRAHNEYEQFCKMAEEHNNNFPKSPIERMCIAQHYGIITPLLDWTRNILVALYFSLEYRMEDDREDGFELFLYHLKDERYLERGIEKEPDLLNVRRSCIVEAPFVDRRIERQSAVFSYHPVPLRKPNKIPVTKYRISEDLFFEVRDIIEGFSYSSAYFFPDYAGLVDRIKKGYML